MEPFVVNDGPKVGCGAEGAGITDHDSRFNHDSRSFAKHIKQPLYSLHTKKIRDSHVHGSRDVRGNMCRAHIFISSKGTIILPKTAIYNLILNNVINCRHLLRVRQQQEGGICKELNMLVFKHILSPSADSDRVTLFKALEFGFEILWIMRGNTNDAVATKEVVIWGARIFMLLLSLRFLLMLLVLCDPTVSLFYVDTAMSVDLPYHGSLCLGVDITAGFDSEVDTHSTLQ